MFSIWGLNKFLLFFLETPLLFIENDLGWAVTLGWTIWNMTNFEQLSTLGGYPGWERCSKIKRKPSFNFNPNFSLHSLINWSAASVLFLILLSNSKDVFSEPKKNKKLLWERGHAKILFITPTIKLLLLLNLLLKQPLLLFPRPLFVLFLT